MSAMFVFMRYHLPTIPWDYARTVLRLCGPGHVNIAMRHSSIMASLTQRRQRRKILHVFRGGLAGSSSRSSRLREELSHPVSGQAANLLVQLAVQMSQVQALQHLSAGRKTWLVNKPSGIFSTHSVKDAQHVPILVRLAVSQDRGRVSFTLTTAAWQLG